VALAALAVAALTFLLYLPSLSSGFVYDGEAQILIGDYIHNPAHWADVLTFRVMGRDVLDFNRPVQLASLMLDAQLWGKNPFGYHLTSNLLHAANAGLVFALLVRLVPRRETLWAAAAGALVFAAHPIVVEPVAEVSSREDPLATVFVLLSLHAGWSCVRRRGARSLAAGAACVGAVVLACGAKELGAMVPVLLLALAVLFGERSAWLRWGMLVGAAALAAGTFLAVRFALEPQDSVIFLNKPGYVGGSLGMAMQIQPRIFAFYLRQLAWPDGLSADYMPQNILAIGPVVGWGILLVFVGLQGVLAWKSRLAAFGVVVFWAGLAPVSNLIPIYRPIADRYLYLPMAGLGIILCAALLLLAARREVFFAAVGAVTLAAFALAGASVRRQMVFANSFALWSDTVSKTPWSDTAANNLAYALLEREQPEESLRYFDRAIQLTEGKKSNAWAGAAVALERLGRRSDAREALRRAVDFEPLYGRPDDVVRAMLITPDQAETLKRVQENR
jgi:tetratricopeptide (TPR) repeat protein